MKTSPCAAAGTTWSSAPRPRRCWPHRSGAAISASCATCWSNWPCAAIRPRLMRRNCAAVLEAGGQATLPRCGDAAPCMAHFVAGAASCHRSPFGGAHRRAGAQAIADALVHTGGNRTAAARLLGISRASLYDRLEAMGELSESHSDRLNIRRSICLKNRRMLWLFEKTSLKSKGF